MDSLRLMPKARWARKSVVKPCSAAVGLSKFMERRPKRYSEEYESRPGVTAPIVGTSTLSHLEDAVASLGVELSPEEMQTLEEPYVPHRVLGFV